MRETVAPDEPKWVVDSNSLGHSHLKWRYIGARRFYSNPMYSNGPDREPPRVVYVLVSNCDSCAPVVICALSSG